MQALAVEPAVRLRDLLAEDPDRIDEFLGTLSGTDAMRAMFRLPEDERQAVLKALSVDAAAEFMEDVPDPVAADMIEALPAQAAASIVAAMPSDEQTDLLAEVESDEVGRILDAMAPDSAAWARTSLAFAPDSAGGLMVREYLAFSPRTTARSVLTQVTSGERDLSRYMLRYAWVVDEARRLVGVAAMRDVVNAAPNTTLNDVMGMPTAVNAGADLALVDACLDEAEEMSLPVTDDDGVLLGILSRTDVDEALIDEAHGNHLKSHGIVGGEELRSMPLRLRSGRRLSWLSINILLNIVAASVIAAFEETLAAAIALAVFLPIVSDMSGCSGNQAVAVSMRELTLGVAGVRDVFRVWWQELKVGLVNGLALGVLLGAVAWLWKGDVGLALVVGVALAANTLVAVSIGGSVPLLLKRFGVDPAVASGPLLTTVTDVCGFFFVLGLATLVLMG